MFSTIDDALARDEPVAIAGFEKFSVRPRAARRGHNSRTGEAGDTAGYMGPRPQLRAPAHYTLRSKDAPTVVAPQRSGSRTFVAD